MKILLKLIFFFSLITSLYASIDEYKSDVYYANGIMMNDTEAKAEKKWQEYIEKIFKNNHEVTDKIKNVKMAYNKSQWFDDDIYEAFEQVMSNEWGWKEFSDYFAIFLKIHGIQEFDNQHSIDLTKQVKAYKQSIKDGHGVIVIAHSQGNYFTNEAYDSLEDWMKDYFHMFGVATPANHVAGYAPNDATAPYVTFHNDIINFVVTGLPSNRYDGHHQGFPSYAAHDFYNSYLTNEETKNDITNFIKRKLDEHIKAPSQWSTKDELGYGTRDYRIKVEHRFDKNVLLNDDVYPFMPSKKLYYIEASQQSHINGYVKGGYGGEAILDAKFHSWENQHNTQFYKLEGTEPPEYITRGCPDSSLYEVISHQNIGTKEWRVTVKNKETQESVEGVYPFNLTGSLYHLDSGEWVIASCGGTAIESSWSGQQDYEIYRLVGTEEKMYTFSFSARVSYFSVSFVVIVGYDIFESLPIGEGLHSARVVEGWGYKDNGGSVVEVATKVVEVTETCSAWGGCTRYKPTGMSNPFKTEAELVSEYLPIYKQTILPTLIQEMCYYDPMYIIEDFEKDNLVFTKDDPTTSWYYSEPIKFCPSYTFDRLPVIYEPYQQELAKQLLKTKYGFK